MKNLITLLLIVLSITSAYPQWQLQNSGTTANLNDITVVPYTNGNSVFVVGDNGAILKTTNNGTEWESIPSGTTNRINAVSFSDSQYGIAVGDEVICFSTDGGESWSDSSINKNAVCVYYYMSEWYGWNILIGCDDGTIFYSSDAGNTFLDTVLTNEPIIATGMIDHVLHIAPAFVSTNSFTCVTGLPIWELTYWNFFYNPISLNDSLTCGKLYSEMQYLVGTGWYPGSLVVLKKYFRDTQWDVTYSVISPPFIPVDIAIYYDYNLFICGNDGKIFTSIDDGSNWTEQITSVNYKLNAIRFKDTTGFAVGDNGTILFTSNGGGINSVDEIMQPIENVLYQNYPNPFNPSTNIQYQINSNSFVQLKIFDVLGNEITTLVNEEQPSGSYHVEFNPAIINSKISSGIYFYQLSTTGKESKSVQTKKLFYLK